jgi:hypothetical protein
LGGEPGSEHRGVIGPRLNKQQVNSKRVFLSLLNASIKMGYRLGVCVVHPNKKNLRIYVSSGPVRQVQVRKQHNMHVVPRNMNSLFIQVRQFVTQTTKVAMLRQKGVCKQREKSFNRVVSVPVTRNLRVILLQTGNQFADENVFYTFSFCVVVHFVGFTRFIGCARLAIVQFCVP